MNERIKNERLPDKDEINEMTDVQELTDLADEIERSIVRIEADLDFREGTDEWEGRAIGALSFRRYAKKLIEKRVAKLTSKKADQNERNEREECLQETWNALEGGLDNEGDVAETEEEIDSAMSRLTVGIDSVNYDRAEEASKPPPKQDLKWMFEANATVKRLKAVRHSLSLKRAAITRAAKEGVRLVLDAKKERLFIEACRDILPAETYRMLWDRVDRQFLEGPPPTATVHDLDNRIFLQAAQS